MADAFTPPKMAELIANFAACNVAGLDRTRIEALAANVHVAALHAKAHISRRAHKITREGMAWKSSPFKKPLTRQNQLKALRAAIRKDDKELIAIAWAACDYSTREMLTENLSRTECMAGGSLATVSQQTITSGLSRKKLNELPPNLQISIPSAHALLPRVRAALAALGQQGRSLDVDALAALSTLREAFAALSGGKPSTTMSGPFSKFVSKVATIYDLQSLTRERNIRQCKSRSNNPSQKWPICLVAPD